MFFGYFVPAIISLKKKIERVQTNAIIDKLAFACEKLALGLTMRFKPFFEIHSSVHDSIVASISCPNIKTRFLNNIKDMTTSYTLEDIKQSFLRYCQQFLTEENQEQSTILPPHSDDKFFLFEDSDPMQKNTNNNFLRRELETYLTDLDTTITCLVKYPIIKSVFLKYNTPLPSSAPVERLFSFAGFVNTPHRSSLSDENFEMLVLLKANNKRNFK